MPDLPPGFALYRQLQPFFIDLGDWILRVGTVFFLALLLVSLGYILRREWGWFRKGVQPTEGEERRGS